MPPDTLTDRLADLIRTAGPISIARYMAEAMGHPKFGYYMNRDPLGQSGDFITAPEVSQMFGELIGLWCATVWRSMGEPSSVALTELGPGRGTLMADALRAAAKVPGFMEAAQVHLVETSPVLEAKQRSALESHRATWHESFDSVPEGPTLVIANELFDALPIRQFERVRRGWCERLVDLDPAGSRFRLVLASPSSDPVPASLREAPLGSVCEVSPAALALAGAVAERLSHHGGAALIIDYGAAESAPRETLQSVHGHKSHDVFEAPGTADICAHVDFGQVAAAARDGGGAVYGPIEQGAFLRELGIETRAAVLSQAGAAQAASVRADLARLTDPAQMGSLFKVLAIAHPDLAPPPGFSAIQ